MSDLKNKLHHLIEGQVPEYLRDTFPAFVDFLTEYYKFLEQNHEANALLLNSNKWSDIDLTIDLFVEEFKKQYSYDFPTDALIERRRLIKFISQYYETKGTENAAELFFRMIYNDTAVIKYPGDYTLKASDGVWKKKYTIKLDTDYDQISNKAYQLLPAPVSANVFNIQNRQIKLRYTKIGSSGLENVSIPLSILNVYNNTTNNDIYEIEIDISQNLNIQSLNETLSTIPFRDVVWLTAVNDAGVEYTYGFLSQQLLGYEIQSGGSSFRRRDTFDIEYPETIYYPIPNQEINNGLVRVKKTKNIDVEEYFAQDYTPAASEYTPTDTQGVIQSLIFLSTGYRFDITGDYFAENYDQENNYTSYNKFSTTLINPRGVGDDAQILFTVGYIYEHPGHWKDNSGFLSDINKLQDNYYYQAYSYVVQTINTPYETWKNIYKQSAHPAGFKVFGELLVEHAITFTPITFESRQLFVEMFNDTIFPMDQFSYLLEKVLDDTAYVTCYYAPDYFAEDYTIPECEKEYAPGYFAEEYSQKPGGDNMSFSLSKDFIENDVLIEDDIGIFHEMDFFDVSAVMVKDEISIEITYLVDVNDTVEISDSVDTLLTYELPLSDTVTIIETPPLVEAGPGVDDNISSTDSSTLIFQSGVKQEFVAVSEINVKNVNKYIDGIDNYSSQQYFSEDYVSDNIVSILDNISIETESNIAETVNVSDVLTLTTLNKNISDTLTISDSMVRYIDQNNDAQSNLAETASFIDSKSYTFDTSRSDATVVTDVPYILTSKAFTDASSISDVVSNKLIEKSATDTFAVSDSLVKNIGYTISDTFINTDAISRNINKTFSDTLTITDELTSLLSAEVLANDGSTISDAITSFLVNKNFSDSVVTSDGMVRFINENDDAQSDLSESASITETLTVSLNISKTDTATLTDVTSKQFTTSKTDSITSSDSKALSINKGTITETITSSDSNIKNYNLVIDDTYSSDYFECTTYVSNGIVYTVDTISVVNNGYAPADYVTLGYATETRAGTETSGYCSTTTTTTTTIEIVSSGLEFYVDAENATSYPGSGTTWNDLSGNSRNITLSNGPTFNSSTPKSFTFDGTDDIGIANTTSLSVGSWTHNVWINTNSGGETRQQILGFTGGGSNVQVNMGIGIFSNYVYFNTVGDIMQGLYYSPTITPGTWYNVCITHEVGQPFNLYVNGSFVSSTNSGNDSIVVASQQRIILGTAYPVGGGPYRQYKGKLGAALSYIRKLSDAEVLQNFNALKGRFGL